MAYPSLYLSTESLRAFKEKDMVKARLAIMIATFAFSTAAMAKPSAPKDLHKETTQKQAVQKPAAAKAAPIVDTGTTPNNVAPADCPALSAASGGWTENRQADQGDVYGALKTQQMDAKVLKPSKQNTRF